MGCWCVVGLDWGAVFGVGGQLYDFTLDQMREFAANAVEASFLPHQQTLHLLRQVEQYR